jgi:pantothenate kinase
VDIYKLLDEKYFVDTDEFVCMERLILRHMGTGLTKNESIERIETNDKINSELILKTKKYSNLLIKN